LLKPQARLGDRELEPAADRRSWFSHAAMMPPAYDIFPVRPRKGPVTVPA
jgi:hypothetical protein